MSRVKTIGSRSCCLLGYSPRLWGALDVWQNLPKFIPVNGMLIVKKTLVPSWRWQLTHGFGTSWEPMECSPALQVGTCAGFGQGKVGASRSRTQLGVKRCCVLDELVSGAQPPGVTVWPSLAMRGRLFTSRPPRLHLYHGSGRRLPPWGCE